MGKWSLLAAFARLFGLTGASDNTAKTGALSVAPTLHSDARKAGHHSLVGQPVLVSLLLGGDLIQQREVCIDGCGQWVFLFRDLPLGTYTVKFEAPGVETVIKKGLVVTATNEPVVLADLRAGQGTRVIEYGKEGPGVVTGLLGRIKDLEAVVAAMNKAG
jgi:hypothetical protein